MGCGCGKKTKKPEEKKPQEDKEQRVSVRQGDRS